MPVSGRALDSKFLSSCKIPCVYISRKFYLWAELLLVWTTPYNQLRTSRCPNRPVDFPLPRRNFTSFLLRRLVWKCIFLWKGRQTNEFAPTDIPEKAKGSSPSRFRECTDSCGFRVRYFPCFFWWQDQTLSTSMDSRGYHLWSRGSLTV